jgi:GntR family transcriptional repressor for pyruvate dehydrogenase complex
MVWLNRHLVTLPAKPPEKNLARAPESAAGDTADTAKTATSEVVGRLRKLIEEGQFTAGSRLPPERVLAAELGVGRPSLREAIKALGIVGILESRRGSGTFVRSVMPPAGSLIFGSTGIAEPGVLDLLEVRKIVEPRAAWLAATRASEHQLREIEGARQRLEMHDRDWKLATRLDCELHTAIVHGAQNPVLVLINQFLTEHLVGRSLAKVRLPRDVERIRRDHKAIVDAILKRQADAAEKAMVDHLHTVSLEFIAEASQ